MGPYSPFVHLPRTHWGFHCCFLPGQLLKSSDTPCMPSTSFPVPPFLSHGSGTHSSSSPIPPVSLGNSSAPTLPCYTVLRRTFSPSTFQMRSMSRSFPLVILGIMLLYIPLFPPMYLHMFTQRKK